MKQPKTPAELHSAGATVIHRSPFSEIVIVEPDPPPTEEIIAGWVKPFYKAHLSAELGDDDIQRLQAISQSVNDKQLEGLLRTFNWRPRSVAARFAALFQRKSLQLLIGDLLLRSDVTYAGGSYALALAAFNDAASHSYLTRYLDYYLKQRDLWFDQGSVLAAVSYLDELNSTSHAQVHLDDWEAFVANKPYWDLQKSISGFRREMSDLLALRNRLGL